MGEQFKKNQIITPKLSMPKGGGTVRGVDENFSADAFTGTANFNIPVQLPQARAMTPAMNISYSSGSGNGLLGIGFSINQPAVSIKTSRSIPRYDVSDVYILNGAELVPSDSNPNIFLERHGVEFPYIEKIVNDKSEVYWKIVSSDNVMSVYGTSEESRIFDPKNSSHIFEWLIKESSDSLGNRVIYNYNKIPGSSNAYLASVEYGNYSDKINIEHFAFKVIIDYGQINTGELINKGDLVTAKDPVPKRPDCITSYRSGFKITTDYLIRNIFIFHNLDITDLLTTGYSFNYIEDKIISNLKEVVVSNYLQQPDKVGYAFKSLPPVGLGFSKFDPPSVLLFDSIKKGGRDFNQPLHFADIEQEGYPGILFRNADTIQYYPARGNGEFDNSHSINKIPTRFSDIKTPMQIASLEGNGLLQLEYENETESGYYQMNGWNNYSSFIPFSNELISELNYRSETVDLTGNNQEDKVIITPGTIQFIESLGLEGYYKARYIENNNNVEAANFDIDPYIHYGFANVYGDGLNHRIKIENKKLTIWPNKGYGNFDSKIEVPVDQLIIEDKNNPVDLRTRLILADVNGSGMTDLVLVYKDGIQVFYNQNGISFSPPETIKFPNNFSYSDFDQVQFIDIMGNGNNCLVFTKNELYTRHYFAKLTLADDKGKAYLLNTINSNMGAQTSITFKSSVKDYLDAKNSKNPWITKLSFPAIVVDTITSEDFISKTSLTSSYTYRNGYYDPIEHAFVGFGCVIHKDKPNNDKTVPVSISKQWFHLGNGTNEEETKKDFFQGDKKAPDIPFQRFENIDFTSITEKEAALYALAGSEIHNEVYDEAQNCPYETNSASFTVIKVQNPELKLKPQIGKMGVYRIYGHENYHVDYELNPEDPMVSQTVVVEADEYNNILSSCNLSYPRRTEKSITELPEQAELHVIAQQANYKNQDNINVRWVGVNLESKSFEIIGLTKSSPDNKGIYYSYDFLHQQISDTLKNQIPYSQNSSGKIAARLLSWQKNYYWNNEQTKEWSDADDFPSILLTHHTATIVMNAALVQNIYEEKINDAEVTEAGYLFESDYWWSRSAVTHFTDRTFYYLLKKISYDWAATDNYKYTKTDFEYDAYQLMVVKTNQYVTENVQLSSRVEIDYRVLSPHRSVDINGNISEVLFDISGVVVASASYSADKKTGDSPLSEFTYKTTTDLNEIFSKPFDFIQKAGSYFYYEFAQLDNNTNEWKPAFKLSLGRTMYKSNDFTDIQRGIVYNDGFGRAIESKHYAASGSMTFSDEIMENRWLSSGRVSYDAKGNPNKTYLGYFSDTWQHQFEWDTKVQPLLPKPTVSTFDALNRTIQVQTPKGFISKVVFPNAWETWSYDANDTIKDSPYYKVGDWKNAANEKDAIEKAALCYNTPGIKVHDNLGRMIRTIDVNRILEKDSTVYTLLKQDEDWCFVQWQSFDIQGRVLQQADARFYVDNKKAAEPGKKYNFIHAYPIGGPPLKSISTDAGTSVVFRDVLGNTLKVWDALGNVHTHTYDHLQRPKTHIVKKHLLDNVISCVYYGEETSAPKNANMLGKTWKLFDSGGMEEMASYTFDGHPTSAYRRFRTDYKTEANWTEKDIAAAEALLEKVIFTTATEYDAAGRILTETLPDKSIQSWQYGVMGNCIRSSVNIHGSGKIQEIVTGSELDANGMLDNFTYANGINTQHIYDKETLRLIQLTSRKSNEPGPFQQLNYTYDPTGLITGKSDNTIPASFYNNQQVKPENDFTYDAIYRLVSTGGRALKGLFNSTNKTNFAKSDAVAVENYFETYTYDKSNNLTRLSRTQTASSFTRNYRIENKSNRVVRYSIGTDTKNLSYDVAGQMQQLAGSNTTLQWNTAYQIAAAILIERENGINDADYYVYNLAGLRIRKVTEKVGENAAITTTDKRYIGAYNVQSKSKGKTVTEIRHRITMNGVAKHDCVLEYFSKSTKTKYATAANPLCRYQHSDLLNSVSVETNNNAEIISYEEYSPYGETTFSWAKNKLDISPKEYRYSAQEKDDNTGLYYYGYRYYEPLLCRWTRPDPAGTIDGFNLYAFVGNEPIARIDMMGLKKGDYEKVRNGAKDIKDFSIKKQEAYTKAKDYREKHNEAITDYLNNKSRKRDNVMVKAGERLTKFIKLKEDFETPDTGGGEKLNYKQVIEKVKNHKANTSQKDKIKLLHTEMGNIRTKTRYGYIVDTGQGPHTNSRVNVLRLNLHRLTKNSKLDESGNVSKERVQKIYRSVFTPDEVKTLEGFDHNSPKPLKAYIRDYEALHNVYTQAATDNDIIAMIAHGQSLLDMGPYSTSRSPAIGNDISGDGEKTVQKDPYRLFDYPGDNRYAGGKVAEMKGFIEGFMTKYQRVFGEKNLEFASLKAPYSNR